MQTNCQSVIFNSYFFVSNTYLWQANGHNGDNASPVVATAVPQAATHSDCVWPGYANPSTFSVINDKICAGDVSPPAVTKT